MSGRKGLSREVHNALARYRRIEEALQEIAGIQVWDVAPNHQYALGRQEEADRLGEIARAALENHD